MWRGAGFCGGLRDVSRHECIGGGFLSSGSRAVLAYRCTARVYEMARAGSAYLETSMRRCHGVGAALHGRGLGVDYGPTMTQLTDPGFFDRNADSPLSCSDMRAAGVDLSGTTCAAAGGSTGTIILAAAAALFLGVMMSR